MSDTQEPMAGVDRRLPLLAALVATLILAGLLALVGPWRVLDHLASADPLAVVLACLGTLGMVTGRHVGYRILCRSADASPLNARFHLLVLFAVIPRFLLPMGYLGGPAINAYYLRKGIGARFRPTVAALAVAEFLALLASGVVLVIGLGLLLIVGGGLGPTGVALAGAFVTVAAVALAIVLVSSWPRGRASGLALWRRLLGVVDRLGPIGRLSRATRALVGERAGQLAGDVSTVAADRRAIGLTFVAGGIGWFSGVLPLYFAAHAVGAPVGIGVAMLAVPASALAGFLPSPGGLGTTDLSVAAVLATVGGLSVATAAAATVIYRLTSIGLELAIGGAAGGVLGLLEMSESG